MQYNFISSYPSKSLLICRAPLRNILYCLLDNACKYGALNSTVETTVRIDDLAFIIAIKNTGVEILPAEEERIFCKFHRGEAISSLGKRPAGIGIGLWIARKLAVLLGGELSFKRDATDRNLNTFVLTIPVLI